MDRMGGTAGIDGPIVYTGTRDELQAKLRARDDRISTLDGKVAALKAMVLELIIELEAEVKARYSPEDLRDSGVMRGRYERDMDPVHRGRAILQT